MFEQAGSTLNLFADRDTNNVLFGWSFPSSWYQSTNSLFIAAEANVPAAAPLTSPSEFEQVISPFVAQAFATGIGQSGGGIGPMAIVETPDGVNRGVRSVEVDGAAITGDVALAGVTGTHDVRVVLAPTKHGCSNTRRMVSSSVRSAATTTVSRLRTRSGSTRRTTSGRSTKAPINSSS